jgi:hypothetical protein
MSIYSLYVKTHKVTNRKYLGQTKFDPFIYGGSGVLWREHLELNGDLVDTMILVQTDDWEALKYWGRFYSEQYKILTAMDDFGDRIWLNLIPETGGGSGEHNLGKKRTPEQCKKIRESTPRLYGEDHWAFDSKIYHWENTKTGEILHATRQEFMDRFPVSRGNTCSHLKGERSCVSGWVALNATPYRGKKIPDTKGSKSPRYDHTQYSWKNLTTGEVIVMTRFHFAKKYNTSSGFVCDHIHGKKKSCKGWAIIR